ncbi:ergosterol biosynthesis ERG4/ERG24 [Tribonema minus]|uniref:Delta(14)-sterol reductase ERG24 n=1 Tax=Tribonema minus TaxID=303371 RepID=A0A836CNY4_9STRA|nr:ergosterol biosynthesis ERG4/ERG24 [Tribonema minus]
MLHVLLQVALERLLPATIALGTPVAKAGNARLPYRINAHLAFWVTLLIMGHACPVINEGRLQSELLLSLGAFDLTVLYTRYAELAACSCLFSVFLSIVLYLAALRPGTVIADPGSSGNPIYDLFMGRELNPRIFNFDLKYFCELRPGLIGWAMLNIGCAAQQYEHTGGVSPGMLVVVFGQGMYVWDAVYYESSILTTMDITSDGFGFMLAFGDLAWVPFIYSFQARYLVDHDPELPWWSYLLLLVLHCLGYAMFRLANKQKDAFRKNPKAPEVAHLKFMQTQRGTKLLVSGWWGMARKINYTGDWLMGLSWCLCCGFDSPLPYFYVAYFGVLLVHRAFRDDHACAAKYGEDWKAYKAKVPYMFIPKVI